MRIFANCLLIATFLAAAVPAPALAKTDTPSGVEMLRDAMVNTPQGDERDYKIRRALPVLQQEAKAGDAKAQYNLAKLYEMGVPSGPNHARVTFPARAYAWYVAAARQGHPLAQKRIAASRPIKIDEVAANDVIDPAPHAGPLSKDDRAAMGMDGTTYQLQIAAFRSAANAASLIDVLQADGVAAFAQHRTDKESGDWHIVESGPLFSRTEAEALRQALKRNFGVDPQVREVLPRETAKPPEKPPEKQ